jgi:DNA topoisomerase-1
MNVVVVESPAKAKTINKYLGPDYTVLASYGHVRDLPAKDGSVRPDDDFAMDWEVDDRSEKRLKDIVQALKGATTLYLATDPDREGEAISWHVREVLKQRRALKDIPVRRVVFNEVTKAAVLDAFKHARDLNDELVDAYMARRALDYLVGFTLSPVLWRKLPGSRSAGRVQSVALRLICEREAEIEAFRAREYWSVESTFATAERATFSARLTHLDGKKLERFDLPDEAAAKRAVAAVEAEPGYFVYRVENRQVKRNPPPPFTTSTLQQEASRKLGFGTSRTMQLAQRLYEGINLGGETVGLITYMRTDGVSLSAEAVTATRALIERDYGPNYRPAQPRVYKTVAKNAQEAHEAIRPTDAFRRPSDVAHFLDTDQLRLYELIWKRTLACQMESALLDQVAVDINGVAGRAAFRATGSVIRFDGFLKLYQEGRDDEEDEENRRLPALKAQDALDRLDVRPEQHFTEPPPRYTEASLVKRLEELGIGRPSTYASIIQVLLDRDYVTLEKKRFQPEDRGRLVTAFLQRFFERYVEYSFTADLENLLDAISDGRADWKEVLRNFWSEFNLAIGGTKDLTITQVLTALDEALGPHFFPVGDGGHDPRLCPTCKLGRLGLRLGKRGAFIGCANYPECRFTRPLKIEPGSPEDGSAPPENGPRLLGTDPATEAPVTVRIGPYGPYIQLGEAKDGEKPKRVSLPKGLKPLDLGLEQALGLLSLPRRVGVHPESGDEITAGIGRFGPYLKHGKIYKSLAADDDVLTIGINRAVSLLAEPAKQGRSGAVALRTVGPHPADAAPIELYKGRYGPYVSHGGVNATLPRDLPPEDVTLDTAVKLLDAQRAKGKPARGKAPPRKAAPASAEKKAPARQRAAAAAAGTDAVKKAPSRKKAATPAEAPAEAKPASRRKTAAPAEAPAEAAAPAARKTPAKAAAPRKKAETDSAEAPAKKAASGGARRARDS